MFGTKARNFFIIPLIISFCSITQANNFSPREVTFSVQSINEIAVFGTPVVTKVNTIVKDSRSIKTIRAISTYSITTNEVNKKITGFLKEDLPEDASLVISLEAPAHATSVGDVPLTRTPSDLVIGVTKVAESGKSITYQISAPVSKNLKIRRLSEIVVLTITD